MPWCDCALALAFTMRNVISMLCDLVSLFTQLSGDKLDEGDASGAGTVDWDGFKGRVCLFFTVMVSLHCVLTLTWCLHHGVTWVHSPLAPIYVHCYAS